MRIFRSNYSRRLWGRVALAVSIACVTGSWTNPDEPAAEPQSAYIRVAQAAPAAPDNGDAVKPPESAAPADETKPLRTPQRSEKPRSDDSVEISIDSEDPEAGRTLLA